MRTELVPFALSNRTILTGILMTACRDLFNRGQAPQHLQLATSYKIACLNSLKRALCAPDAPLRNETIVQAALLAGDEVTQFALLSVGEADGWKVCTRRQMRIKAAR